MKCKNIIAKMKTKILKNSKKSILYAAELLKKGDTIALPTETVYGLAGRYDNNKTIEKIFSIKNRPLNNPFIIHYSSSDLALADIYFDSRAEILAKKFWPGPLTLVAKVKNKKISKLALSGLETVAVRVPSNKIILSIIEHVNIPLAAPSANRYGKLSPTSAKDVYEELNGKISTIYDGGSTNIGVESTVVDISKKETAVLRYGGIDESLINDLTNLKRKKIVSKKFLSPGLSKSHYKPNTPLRINASYPKKNEGWLAFGKKPKNFKGIILSLSKKKCLKESAKNLYKMLRLLDKKDITTIAVQKIPKRGIGLAINDRLERAAYNSKFKNE